MRLSPIRPSQVLRYAKRSLVAAAAAGVGLLGLSVVAEAADAVPWSQKPPAGLAVDQVPQLVALTVDDNYGLEDGGTGGINFICDFFGPKTNPAGTGNAATFDSAPTRATFYLTSTYGTGAAYAPNLKAWQRAYKEGHEVADHTINHPNGGELEAGGVGAKHFSAAQWVTEMRGCRDLVTSASGVGAKVADFVGFRTPFLSYNDNTYTAAAQLGFLYDSTIPNCFGAAETALGCSWPYTMDTGSPDADALGMKFGTPALKGHPGFWQVPVTTLIVPPDEVAAQYGFKAGLRGRIPKMPYPSIYEADTGKIAGMDWTLFADGKMAPEEVTATLKYTLDQHLAGNRAPLVYVAHSFMYSFSNKDSNPDTPTAAIRDARWASLTAFLTYAMSKPDVRMVRAKDIVAWMQHPVPLRAAGSGTGGAGGSAGGADAGTAGAGGSSAGDDGAVGPQADASVEADAGSTGGAGGSESTGTGGSAGAGNAGISGGSSGDMGGAAGGAGGTGGTSGRATGGSGGSGSGAGVSTSKGGSGGCTYLPGQSNGAGWMSLFGLAIGVALMRRRRR